MKREKYFHMFTLRVNVNIEIFERKRAFEARTIQFLVRSKLRAMWQNERRTQIREPQKTYISADLREIQVRIQKNLHFV